MQYIGGKLMSAVRIQVQFITKSQGLYLQENQLVLKN